MCSAPHERYLAVTVKEERFVPGVTKYPPLLSPLLVKRTVRGMRLVVTGFTGPYTLPPDITSKTDHIVHICAGSGSVPNLSILKFALEHHPGLRHTFIYSNKTWGDVIFRISKWDREAAKEAGTAPQPKFIETVLASLRAMGVPDARIRRESYG
jgi:ferredoxin-NADP reductase